MNYRKLTDEDMEALRQMDWTMIGSDPRWGFEDLDVTPQALVPLNELQWRADEMRRLGAVDRRIDADLGHLCLVARCFIIARETGRPEMAEMAQRIMDLQPLEEQEVKDLQLLMHPLLVGHPTGLSYIARLEERKRGRPLAVDAPNETAS